MTDVDMWWLFLFADAVCKDPASCFDPHAGKCFYQCEFGQGGCLLHPHHIKAMEPFFSVLLSVLFLGEVIDFRLCGSFRLNSGILHNSI